MDLLEQYEFLKKMCYWTDSQIMAFYSDMSQVISANSGTTLASLCNNSTSSKDQAVALGKTT